MSAKRFGGQYSPGGASEPDPASPNRFRDRRAHSVDVRALLMFVLPTPLLLAAFSALSAGNALKMVVLLVAYVCLMLGAWLVREGQKAQAEYDARTIARAPAFPRKLCAAGLAGAGVFIASLMASSGSGILSFAGDMISAAIFGILAVGAHVLAFGIDPMKAKGTGNIDRRELDRVTDALEKAESKLETIEALAHKMNDREIDDRVRALNSTVREMIKLVEQDPRDLSRAKRYLNVYLTGAEEATRKYADNHERLKDPALRGEYLALLTDLQASFERGKDTLLVDDRTDLEVEIEVLRDRLGQEGT